MIGRDYYIWNDFETYLYVFQLFGPRVTVATMIDQVVAPVTIGTALHTAAHHME